MGLSPMYFTYKLLLVLHINYDWGYLQNFLYMGGSRIFLCGLETNVVSDLVPYFVSIILNSGVWGRNPTLEPHKNIVYIYMPMVIRKLRNQNLYKVINKETGQIHSKGTTLNKAKAQKRLLDAIDERFVGYKWTWYTYVCKTWRQHPYATKKLKWL